MANNITLFGGKMVTVRFEPLADGTVPAAQEIKVRQIPVRDYEAGFPLVDDEPALVSFLAGKDRPWSLTTAPASFEEILVTGREVNAQGFFSYCQRHTARLQAREARQQADMIGLMATLPPEQIKAMTERGLELQRQSRSPSFSPGYVSPPAR